MLRLVAPRDGAVLPPPLVEKQDDDTHLPTWHGSPFSPENLGASLTTERSSARSATHLLEARLAIDQNDVEFVAHGQKVEVMLDQSAEYVYANARSSVSRQRPEDPLPTFRASMADRCLRKGRRDRCCSAAEPDLRSDRPAPGEEADQIYASAWRAKPRSPRGPEPSGPGWFGTCRTRSTSSYSVPVARTASPSPCISASGFGFGHGLKRPCYEMDVPSPPYVHIVTLALLAVVSRSRPVRVSPYHPRHVWPNMHKAASPASRSFLSLSRPPSSRGCCASWPPSRRWNQINS